MFSIIFEHWRVNEMDTNWERPQPKSISLYRLDNICIIRHTTKCTMLVTLKEKFPADFTSKEMASSNINGKNMEKNIKADVASWTEHKRIQHWVGIVFIPK